MWKNNHWWRHSLAHVVEDRVWYTLRGENFYYRRVWGNASPPQKEKRLSSEGVQQLPSPPSLFWCLCITKENVWESKLIFWRKVKTIIFLGNNLTKLHFWRKLLLAILLLSGPNRKCLSCWVMIIIFLI